MTATSQICRQADVTVEYFRHGTGTPVLLLPGASLNCAYLEGMANALAEAGYCAIRVNPRGAGRSSGPSETISMKSYADDVRILVDHLDLGPVDIGGHAFGNRIARATAHYHPDQVKSLILLAAGGAIAPKPEASAALQVILAPNAPLADIMQAMRFMVGDPKDVELGWAAVKASRCPEVSDMQRQALANPDLTWLGGPDHWPWLIVQGSNDQIAPPKNGEDIKAQFGDKVVLVSIEGAGHLMVVTRPEEATGAIVEFLKARDDRA
ncbi:MAG TPA: hypothetical protein DER67_00095 [Novosphingobium sp.]|nr:hypothetical protein [Novosphingobium sp.]